MVVGLICLKLRKYKDERALTRDVLRTVSFSIVCLVNIDKDAYIDTLIHLVVDNVLLCEIIKGLIRDLNTLDTRTCLLENILAAAISLN